MAWPWGPSRVRQVTVVGHGHWGILDCSLMDLDSKIRGPFGPWDIFMDSCPGPIDLLTGLKCPYTQSRILVLSSPWVQLTSPVYLFIQMSWTHNNNLTLFVLYLVVCFRKVCRGFPITGAVKTCTNLVHDCSMGGIWLLHLKGEWFPWRLVLKFEESRMCM